MGLDLHDHRLVLYASFLKYTRSRGRSEAIAWSWRLLMGVMMRSSQINGRWRWLRGGERGQAMVLWALMAVVLIGVVGLTIDGSNVTENRRKLQNAADAAALAGAVDLPDSSTAAQTSAIQYLTANGFGGANDSLTLNQVSTTNFANDTITVTLRRTVPFSLSGVLGLTSADVTATAKVVVSGATRMSYCYSGSGTPCNPGFFPYLVWNKDVNTNQTHQVGDIVTFRSNAWIADNVYNYRGNANWNTNANDFKGFLCMDPPGCAYAVIIGDNQTKGGNRCGQEPVAALQALYNANEPITLPVADSSTGNGNNQVFHIIGYYTLNLRVPGTGLLSGCPNDFLGQIISYTSTSGTANSGDTQPPTYAACGTGAGACVPRLVQ